MYVCVCVISCVLHGLIDSGTPKRYYFNNKTNMSQTDPPELPLPAGWEEQGDEKGRRFYFQAATDTTQWERPLPDPADWDKIDEDGKGGGDDNDDDDEDSEWEKIEDADGNMAWLNKKSGDVFDKKPVSKEEFLKEAMKPKKRKNKAWPILGALMKPEQWEELRGKSVKDRKLQGWRRYKVPLAISCPTWVTRLEFADNALDAAEALEQVIVCHAAGFAVDLQVRACTVRACTIWGCVWAVVAGVACTRVP